MLRLLSAVSVVLLSFIFSQSSHAAVGDFYSYGGIGDGASHPLSSITTYHSMSTTGWTLARWQQVLPAATSLGNEADEVAVQSMINAQAGDGVVTLPAGRLLQTRPYLSGHFAISVHGAGVRATYLEQTAAGQDGWHHGTRDTPYPAGPFPSGYYSQLFMSDLSFLCGAPSGTPFACGTVIRANFEASSGGFRVTDLGATASGNQSDNYWHDGFDCNNCSFTYLTRVIIGGRNGGNLNTMGTGLNFTGNLADQYVIRDTTVNNFNYAFKSQTGPNDLEGFLFDSFQANQDNYGIVALSNVGNTNPSAAHPPQYVITNSQFNICKTLFYLQQTAEVQISNNLAYGCSAGTQTGGAPGYTQYIGSVTGATASGSTTVKLTAAPPAALTTGVPFSGPGIPLNDTISSIKGSALTLAVAATATVASASFQYGGGSPGFDATEFIVINNVNDVQMHDNIFEFGATANISTLGHFIHCTSCKVTNNIANSVYNQTMTTGWYNDFGDGTTGPNGLNIGLIETGSRFTGMPTTFSPVAGGLNGASLGTRFASYYALYGAELGENGEVRFANSAAGNTNASGELAVYLPPVCTTIPTLLATNGGMEVAPYACGAEYSNTTLGAAPGAYTPLASTSPNFLAKCPGAVSIPVRINYTSICR